MTALPAALAPWSRQLAALTPSVARSLGPMIHRLDEFVGRHVSAEAADGFPDGFDGLSRRGTPERLLVSQWLLAQEIPEEFLRRAAMGELLHLAPARIHDTARGGTVLLADCGPDLHGAPRLVQLALAMVLHRRAAAAGRELRFAVLGADAGSWLEGDLPAVLGRWLAARSRRPATASDLSGWLAAVDSSGDAWVVTGRRLAREWSAAGGVPARIVTVEESEWTDSGPSAVTVALAGENLHLPLPDPRVGIRVLRGQGWRRDETATASGITPTAMGWPSLSGGAPVLLARGGDPGEIIAQRVPRDGGAAGRVRRHQFEAPVLAASMVGSRLVALIVRDGLLEARVVGERLAAMHQIGVQLPDVGLAAADVAALVAGPLCRMFFQAGALLVHLAGRWWSLEGGQRPVERSGIAAVAESAAVDSPVVVTRSTHQLLAWGGACEGQYGPLPVNGRAGEVRVGAGALAWHDGARRWRLGQLPARQQPGAGYLPPGPPDGGVRLEVDDGARVVGLVRIGDTAGLLTVGKAGLLVKFVTGDGTRTLTRWSGGVGALGRVP